MNAFQPYFRAHHGGIVTKLLLVLGVVLIVGAILWTMLLPWAMVSTIHTKTGFVVRADRIAVNPFTAKLTIEGLVLKNPADWPVEDFVELRQFRVEANLFSLFSQRYVADEVALDLAKVTLVRNQQGALNAAVFNEKLTGGAESSQSQPSGEKRGFLIKHLVLKFDKLVYADCAGRKPVIKEYQLNFSREMRDVDSIAKIINPITDSALGLVTDAMGGLLKGRPDLLKEATSTLQGVGKKTGEKLKGLLESLDKKKP